MIKTFTIPQAEGDNYKSYDKSHRVSFDFNYREKIKNSDGSESEIDRVKMINIFYGANGSGKSSIKDFLFEHPELANGANILPPFDENFITNRFIKERNALLITEGEADRTEKRKAEEAIQKYELFKTSLHKGNVEREYNVHKVIRGLELVYSDVYDGNIESSKYKTFFLLEKNLFADFKNKPLTKNDVKNLKNAILNFKNDIKSDDLTEIQKSFLEQLCDFNVNILDNIPELLSSTVPCFCLYFSLTTKLDEDRENGNYRENNEFFNTIDENKIVCFFNTFIDKINTRIDKSIARFNILKNVKDPELVAKKINSYLSLQSFFDIYVEVAEESNRTYFNVRRTFSDKTTGMFKTLSEGEKHLLAFLYFYELCLGYVDFDEAVNPKKKIILIDDPITSMDANAMFLISKLICDLFEIEDLNSDKFKNDYIEQGFVFTHNGYFLRDLLYRMRFNDKHYNSKMQLFYVYKDIETVDDNKYVYYSCVEKKDGFSSEYSLLWETYFKLKKNNNDDSNRILLPNVCRRILESYGKFSDLDDSDSVSKILRQYDQKAKKDDKLSYEEKVIYDSFISYINSGSHFISATDSMNFPSTASYTKVFELLFNKIDKQHFKLKKDKYDK